MSGFKDFRSKNGSRQGHNLALTVLLVPYSLDITNPHDWTISSFLPIFFSTKIRDFFSCRLAGRRMPESVGRGVTRVSRLEKKSVSRQKSVSKKQQSVSRKQTSGAKRCERVCLRSR